jgi:bidirectional [NiFe] hydrogenase diaphorase subunit
MSEILLQIDGRKVQATEEMTILDAARSAGISIPTLCYNEKLEPYGACRICTVEVESGGRTSLAAACVRPVEKDLIVRTRSEKVDRIRKMLVQEALAHASDSEELQNLAQQYGADKDRFEKESSLCILCGLCVRYCTEIKKKDALGFLDRGVKREISFIPEVASKECWNCKECFSLCPTSALHAAWALIEALAFPNIRFQQKPEKEG